MTDAAERAATLPHHIRPATAATNGGAIHAGWLAYSHTLCDRPVKAWRGDLTRADITCRSCITDLGRFRFAASDYQPPVTLLELEREGFLI